MDKIKKLQKLKLAHHNDEFRDMVAELVKAVILLDEYGRPSIARLARNAVTETEQAHWQAKLDAIDKCLDKLFEEEPSTPVEPITTISRMSYPCINGMVIDESFQNIRRTPETDKLFVPISRPDTNLPDHIVTLTKELSENGLVPINPIKELLIPPTPRLLPDYRLVVIKDGGLTILTEVFSSFAKLKDFAFKNKELDKETSLYWLMFEPASVRGSSFEESVTNETDDAMFKKVLRKALLNMKFGNKFSI